MSDEIDSLERLRRELVEFVRLFDVTHRMPVKLQILSQQYNKRLRRHGMTPREFVASIPELEMQVLPTGATYVAPRFVPPVKSNPV